MKTTFDDPSEHERSPRSAEFHHGRLNSSGHDHGKGADYSDLPRPGLREKASKVWHDTTSEIFEGPMAFQQIRSADVNHRQMTHAQQAADRKLPYHVRVDQAEKARGNR